MEESLAKIESFCFYFIAMKIQTVKKKFRTLVVCHRLNVIQITFIIIFIFSSKLLFSQTYDEIGIPFIKSFTLEDYQAHGQNWAITQDKKGVMYFGNTMGVLEYDGLSWRLHPFTSIVRSIDAGHNGRIFVGAQGDFGYLKADSTGTNKYISLLSELPENDQNFTNVWKTHATPRGGAYFNAITHLFRLENDSIRIWYPGDGRFGWSFMIRDTLFIQKRGIGIYKMVKDKLELLPGTEEIAQVTIFFILPLNDSELLIGTRARGLDKYKNGVISSFKTEVDDFFEKNGVYTAKVLNDGSIAIGTQGGLVIMTNDGNLIKFLTNSDGLLDKSVLSLFTDQQNHLWVGLQSGISRIDWPSSISWYGQETGVDSQIEVVLNHNDTLYVAGRSGLYYLKPTQINNDQINNSKFIPLEELKGLNCSALLSFGRRLIIGTNDGIYEYYNGRAIQIGLNKQYVTCLHHSGLQPERIYIGGPELLSSCKFSKGNWIIENKIHGIISDIRPILEREDGQLWVGTRYGGPLLVDLSEGWTENPNIKQYDASFGLPDGDVYVFSVRDRIVFATDSGLYQFDEPTESFSPDYTAGQLFAGKPNGKEVFRISEDYSGDLWIVTAPRFGVQRIQDDGKFIWDSSPFMKVNPNIYSVFPEKNHIIWLGGNGGIYRYDGNVKNAHQEDYYTLIRKVLLNNDSLIYNGNHFQYSVSTNQQKSRSKFNYKQNALRFEFSATDFHEESAVEYQYILKGFDKAWSTWSKDKRKEYTNLPKGYYVFRVKAKNIYGHIGQEDTFSFLIMPPWWGTWWAFIIFSVLILGVITVVVFWYAQYRTREQRKKLAKEQEINRRLKQVDKLKDQFLANTSHELRTPLTGIIGISESLMDGVAGSINKSIKNNISLIISSARRLASLVNSILDYSKLKTHELVLSLQPIDIRTITDVVIQINQPLIKGKSIIIKSEIEEGIPLVHADEERLYQIMHNLVGNAIKFTTTGEIIISAIEKQNMVQVCVQDTGIGIPEDKIDGIFRSFEQVDASITRHYGGTGLGLTITKQLVELHSGLIWIESVPDKGTKVYFTIPVSEQQIASKKQDFLLSKVKDTNDPQESEKFELQMKLGENGSKFSIMIVDDEIINQQVLKNHLSKEHFQIWQAMNGIDALEIIEKEKLDLVLLDIMMPKMSGYEVCKEIRKKYLPSELPVIMITAKDQVQDLIEGLASGANDYLAKPFSKDELLARLRTHLNLYHINSAYLRFIPKEFLKALGHDSIIDVSLGDQVQDIMTILFVDIRSFTSISEKLSAKESFEFLNEFLKYITPAITQHNGFIDKYIGDAVMALFPNKPEDAVMAAILIQKKLKMYNKERKLYGNEKINIGIGIHTGSLMLGTIGVEDRMDGTVISDAVNLASRLEELNKLYWTSMIVSEETIKDLSNLNQYSHRFLSYVRVKGKEKAVKIYEFFDGDDPDEKSLKLKTQQIFNDGIKEYYNQRFTQASVKFQEVLDLNPADHTAKLFLEKSAQFMVRGVPKDWDGIDIVEKVF